MTVGDESIVTNYFEDSFSLISKKDCLGIGGHCYKISSIVVDTHPPTFSRTCKHCGHTQYGMEQDRIAWNDVDA